MSDSNELMDLYARIDDMQVYGTNYMHYNDFRVEVHMDNRKRVQVVLWGEGTCLNVFTRRREEGIEAAFTDAWTWLYNQPPYEIRELKRVLAKITGLLEELGEGESDIVRAAFRKLFDVREELSHHLLEYKGGGTGGV
jgi:hypothetical protein